MKAKALFIALLAVQVMLAMAYAVYITPAYWKLNRNPEVLSRGHRRTGT